VWPKTADIGASAGVKRPMGRQSVREWLCDASRSVASIDVTPFGAVSVAGVL
jgi:hypothetical protein